MVVDLLSGYEKIYSFIFCHHFSVRFVLDVKPVLGMKIDICPKTTFMEKYKVVQNLSKIRRLSMYTICIVHVSKKAMAW